MEDEYGISLEEMQHRAKLRHQKKFYGVAALSQQDNNDYIKPRGEKRGRKPKPRPEKRRPDVDLRLHLQVLYEEGVKRVAEHGFLKKKYWYPKVKSETAVDGDKMRSFLKERIIPRQGQKYYQEDVVKKIERPPARYTNSCSPFGLWDELRTA